MEIRSIIKLAGGPVRVGRAVGVSHSAVCKWNLVPPKHVLAVAKLSGISEHVIRPDIFGANGHKPPVYASPAGAIPGATS